MKKLSEHLKENIPNVNLEDAKKVIEQYRSYLSLMHNKICGICYKEISTESAAKITPHDFHYTCSEHLPYSKHFQAELVRKELGIKIQELNLFDL